MRQVSHNYRVGIRFGAAVISDRIKVQVRGGCAQANGIAVDVVDLIKRLEARFIRRPDRIAAVGLAIREEVRHVLRTRQLASGCKGRLGRGNTRIVVGTTVGL